MLASTDDVRSPVLAPPWPQNGGNPTIDFRVSRRANYSQMERQLLEEVTHAERLILTASGYGSITITYRLERPPEVETRFTKRVAAA